MIAESGRKLVWAYLAALVVIIFTASIAGCGPSAGDLAAVDYTPLVRDDWEVSTPEEQGLDPMLVARMYYNVARHETIYSLLRARYFLHHL